MYFKKNDISIYYEKYGKKKDIIVIFPGWGNTRKTFNEIVKKLSRQYTVYIFDYPGFGNSTLPNTPLTIYDYCDFFNSFFKDNDIKYPTIIGHSFGGRVAIVLNGYYKIPFKKIILMSSAGIKPQKTKKQKNKEKIYKFLKKTGNLLPRKFKNNYLNKLVKFFGSTDFKTIPNELRKTFINIVNEDLTKYIDKINTKTLLIWGENDIDTPIQDAYIMNKSIKDSKLKIIRKASHFFYLENINETLQNINDFLKEKD